MTVPRGALIAIEGIDRCGKSTQVALLAKSITPSLLLKFPNRKSESGIKINAYLTNKLALSDEDIHLLFALNRRESEKMMIDTLQSGTTIIVDRYAYSGVAYSTAKGMDYIKCKKPDKGIPKPDIVFYLSIDPEIASSRMGYGEERYEVPKLQTNAALVFDKLMESNWVKINASKSELAISKLIYTKAKEVVDKCKYNPIDKLWIE